MNDFHKTRYNRFIDNIRNLGERQLDEYTEVHHIIPKCMGGDDSPSNLIRLRMREHFLAHWMLWKAYPNNFSLASAFLQMNNKNNKLSYKGPQKRINSKTYAVLKEQVYETLSEMRKDKVYVKDDSGNTVVLTRKEYAEQDTYEFHTTGKISVIDVNTGKSVYVTTEEYRKNKQQYHHHLLKAKFDFIDLETNDTVLMTKEEARIKNNELGYKRFKQLQQKTLPIIDQNGEEKTIMLAEYDPEKHTHCLKNMVSVYDLLDSVQKFISKDEYKKDPSRYRTSTKGKVLVKDETGNSVLVDKAEFVEKGMHGHTKGLRTVKNIHTGMFEQITEKEYQDNKQMYVGPNKGKVNVIDKVTGERKQILKSEFDKNRFCGLGNKKFLFKCRNTLTGKEKNINIYEWHLMKENYEILDYEKYQIAKQASLNT